MGGGLSGSACSELVTLVVKEALQTGGVSLTIAVTCVGALIRENPA